MNESFQVDWGMTARLVAKVPIRNPSATYEEITRSVDELHSAADQAIELLSQTTQLPPSKKPTVFAIDRTSWMRANTEIGASFFNQLGAANSTSWQQKILRWIRAAVFAGGLTVVGRMVVGQYDPFYPGGRLLLIVPNIIHAELRAGFHPADFRLWVCLHEQTHALQFGSAPWLIPYIVSRVQQIVLNSPEGVLLPTTGSDRTALDELWVVMSLVEGHAEIMMDLAGREAIPTWESMRIAVKRSRAKRKDSLLSRLGLFSKIDQYERGAKFCAEIVERAGIGELNQAFMTAEKLPTLAELVEPENWLSRVNG